MEFDARRCVTSQNLQAAYQEKYGVFVHYLKSLIGDGQVIENSAKETKIKDNKITVKKFKNNINNNQKKKEKALSSSSEKKDKKKNKHKK